MQQEKQIWLEQLAAKPNEAYLIAHLLLKTIAVIAYPSGRALNTFKCDIVDSYCLNPIAKCNKNIPV